MSYESLLSPKGMVDVILDTDAYNEIDDQFAIAYMLRSPKKFNIKGICAAPFFNEKSVSPTDGMEKSYCEIRNLLHLAGCNEMNNRVFHGSEHYLLDEKHPFLLKLLILSWIPLRIILPMHRCILLPLAQSLMSILRC